MVQPAGKRPTSFEEASERQGKAVFGTRMQNPSLKDGRLYFKEIGQDGIEAYTGFLGWLLSVFGVTEALPKININDGKTVSNKVVYVRVKDVERWFKDHNASVIGGESLYQRIQRVVNEIH